MVNESTYTREIKKALIESGGKDLFVLKVNPGNASYMMPGVPDLLICYKGRFAAVEIKLLNKLPKRDNTPLYSKNPFTSDQMHNLKMIQKSRGAALGLIIIKELHKGILVDVDAIEVICRHTVAQLRGFLEVCPESVIFRAAGTWNCNSLFSVLNNRNS